MSIDLLRPLALVLLLAGCSGGSTEGAGPAPDAHASVVPGTYEDWCAEHQVPESQCTRCDPSLSAAFQATGDWCKEHGLPESQCKTCNPELVIERPKKGG